jgi:eukaryotic-like serine/threonine-protein kinase
MSLSPGIRLGAYEIVSSLGAGGMGEVYRARDTRLGRDVAIKVLPEMLATDPDALARFEREMQTLAALSHPHIVAIYDVGREGRTAFAVTELLHGETLADTLARGPLPVRKAIEYGVQIARALGAAHERGIIHRDLKPGNVFIGSDGHVKVLDFGLARNAAAVEAGLTMTGTRPGIVMGTVGYMAPEQTRGLVVDHRADIFSFGCVIYEMISGRRAFERDSAADTLSAILKEDPPPLAGSGQAIPPALERVVQRCLEKHPEERFQSARDLAFALDALSTPTGAPVTAASIAAPAGSSRRWRPVTAAALIVAALAAAFVLGRALAPATNAQATTITRLTFDRGLIRDARFASDGETVVYGAAWNGAPLKIFGARLDTRESKPLDLPDGDILALSNSGDMLMSLARRYSSAWTPDGTLARGRLFSSSVRELLEHVRFADFMPGDRLAIVRRLNGRDRLEAPQGTVVFETPGYVSHLRVAPDGQRIAFLEHPLFGDNRGYLSLYDGKTARRLTPEYAGIETLAWSPDGREIWYSGATTDTHWKIKAVDADARVARDGRTVWYVPRDLLVLDIDSHGRVLLTGSDAGGALAGATSGETRDRDLNWGRWTLPGHVSRDGRTMLLSSLDEFEPDYKVMMRSMDGAAPVQIGRGRAQELSPDGKWALSITPSEPHRVLLFPTGPGEPREVTVGDLDPTVAAFVPRGFTVAVVGRRNGSPAAVVADMSSGKRIALDLSALRGRAFSLRRYLPTHASPDGSLLAVQADDGKVLAWNLDNPGPPRELAALADNEAFVGWPGDRARIYVAAWNGPNARIDALDLTSHRRTTIREIAVADPAGMMMVPDLYLSADASSYIYGFSRMLSTLYVVTGLR